jgi:hypothetical protein
MRAPHPPPPHSRRAAARRAVGPLAPPPPCTAHAPPMRHRPQAASKNGQRGEERHPPLEPVLICDLRCLPGRVSFFCGLMAMRVGCCLVLYTPQPGPGRTLRAGGRAGPPPPPPQYMSEHPRAAWLGPECSGRARASTRRCSARPVMPRLRSPVPRARRLAGPGSHAARAASDSCGAVADPASPSVEKATDAVWYLPRADVALPMPIWAITVR